MVTKAAEKIIEGLTQLMEGYNELQEAIEADFTGEESADDDDDSDSTTEIDAAIITEMRASLEAVIDTEDYSAEEIAAAVSSVTEALEEIDPDVFDVSEGEDEEEETETYSGDDDDYDDDDDDIDDADDDDSDDDYDEDEEDEDDDDDDDDEDDD